MACETMLKPRQSLAQRKDEIKRATEALDRALMRRTIKPIISPAGAITFAGWAAQDKDGMTDACAYRRIMATGSALARAEIARAEQMAGRSVDRRVLATGEHSHDGGSTWDRGHR